MNGVIIDGMFIPIDVEGNPRSHALWYDVGDFNIQECPDIEPEQKSTVIIINSDGELE